jgi:hypothetical protein
MVISPGGFLFAHPVMRSLISGSPYKVQSRRLQNNLNNISLGPIFAKASRRLVRNCIVAVFCAGLVFMTRFPIYGGGGHGPIRWHPLSKLLGDFNKSYGAGTVEIVYGAAILLLCGTILIRKLKKNRR